VLVNGAAVPLRTDSESLDMLLSRLSAAGVGTTASFDATSQTVSIRPAPGRSRMVLDDNGTGFFAALGIADGRHDARARESAMSQRRVQRITDAAAELADAMNALFSDRNLLNDGDPAVRALRREVQAAVTAALGGTPGRAAAFGLGFNETAGPELDGAIASLDRRRLSRKLRQRSDDALGFFSGTRERAGFVQALGNTLRAVANRLGVPLDGRGQIIDISA
jgi:hypothetical protein